MHNKGNNYTIKFCSGHLHSGNVSIQDDRIKLMDVENGVLGVPSFYRPYFMQHRRICTLEAIDVYCFGHTLYEMAFGGPLQESTCDNFPSDLSPTLSTPPRPRSTPRLV